MKRIFFLFFLSTLAFGADVEPTSAVRVKSADELFTLDIDNLGRGSFKIKGGTDNTTIGNVSDRLKVDAIFTSPPAVTANQGTQGTNTSPWYVNLRSAAGVEQGTSGAPLRIDPTGSTTQPISAVSLPLPAGASTSALQTAGNSSLSSIDNGIPTALGSSTIAGSMPVNIASDQVVPISATALPLPAGAATSALQTSGNSSLSSIDGKTPTIGQKTIAGSSPVVSPSEGTNAAASPTVSTLIGGSDGTNLVPIAVDSLGRLVTSSLTGFGADFRFGDRSTAATTRVLVQHTTYTEQTTGAQRSIASASANDTAAGTGARTVEITYLTLAGTGPFTEVLTLNGTTGVNTVATDIAYIERIEVLTAGSGGSNAGILSLYTAINKGGAVFATIGVAENQTAWAHHYIPAGKICNITGISAGHNGTTVGSGALFTINAKTLALANSVETQVSDFVRLYGQSSTFSRVYTSPIKVSGPARIRVYVTPETATATTYRSAIDFFEP